VVDHRFILSAQVKPVIQIAARSPIVVDRVARIVIAAGALVGINPIPAIGAGAGGVAVVMDFVVDDAVAVGPNRDAAVGAVADLEPIHHIVIAVNIEALVAIRSVPSVNDGSAPDLGLQHDRAGGRPALAEVNPPAAGVVGIDPGGDVDGGASPGQTIGMGDSA